MKILHAEKRYHTTFSVRLPEIYLILIWANAKNTISHLAGVSYDLLEVLPLAVLCFYSAVSAQTNGETGSL